MGSDNICNRDAENAVRCYWQRQQQQQQQQQPQAMH